MHKQTSNFIDIEAPAEDVWFDCDNYPDSDAGYFAFYASHGEAVYMFFYRRPLSIKGCKADERFFAKMTKGAKTIRLVGISQTFSVEESATKIGKLVPHLWSAVFIRAQVGDKCDAFFEHHCKLPENYWGGTYPQ